VVFLLGDDLIGGQHEVEPVDVPEPPLKVALIQKGASSIPVFIRQGGQVADRADLRVAGKGKHFQRALGSAQRLQRLAQLQSGDTVLWIRTQGTLECQR